MKSGLADVLWRRGDPFADAWVGEVRPRLRVGWREEILADASRVSELATLSAQDFVPVGDPALPILDLPIAIRMAFPRSPICRIGIEDGLASC